jgi:hypothetical protein
VSGRYGFLRRWQIALRESGLSKAAKSVGAFLSFRMGQDGTIATSDYPAIGTLAKDASISESTAGRGLRELHRAGLVDVQSGKGRRVVNRYTLTLPDHLDVRVEYVLSGGKTRHHDGLTRSITTGDSVKDDVENPSPRPTSIAVSNALAAASSSPNGDSPQECTEGGELEESLTAAQARAEVEAYEQERRQGSTKEEPVAPPWSGGSWKDHVAKREAGRSDG